MRELRMPAVTPRVVRALAALLALALVIVLATVAWMSRDGTSTESVAIREAGTTIDRAAPADALAFITRRSGIRPILPTELPRGGYRLSEVGTVRGEDDPEQTWGVYFRYEAGGSGSSAFWVNQTLAGLIRIPPPLKEINTGVRGARIWLLSRPPEADETSAIPLSFLAANGSYDRIVSFEGGARPDTDRAREVIESMLRQDPQAPVAATGTPTAPPVLKPPGYGNEIPLGATPVTTCPLTPAGCAAAVGLLATVAAGDYGAIQPRVPITYPIGGKPGYDIVDVASFKRALDQARQELNSVAVGCPQGNLLGPEAGACDDLFVLALPITLALTGPGERTALGFMFIREGDRFLLDSVVIDPGASFTRGGGALGIALPLEVTGGKSSLWYTPWHR